MHLEGLSPCKFRNTAEENIIAFILSKARVKFASLWSDGKNLPYASVCIMLPVRIMDIHCYAERLSSIICLFVQCFPSVKCILSIFFIQPYF